MCIIKLNVLLEEIIIGDDLKIPETISVHHHTYYNSVEFRVDFIYIFLTRLTKKKKIQRRESLFMYILL